MSDAGQQTNPLLQINASAAQIETKWLRDAVTAFCVLARPVGIMSVGVAIAVAAVRASAHQPISEWDVGVVAIAAGVFGAVSWFRTKDKANVAAGQ